MIFINNNNGLTLVLYYYTMIKRILIINVVLSSLLGAQSLTMQESIDKALSNHPDIKSFELKIYKSKKSYRSAFSDYMPQITAQANYNPTETFVFPSNGSFQTIDDDAWGAGVSLKQMIWDFKKTSSKVEATQLDEDISTLSLKEAQALLVNKVKSLYIQMILQEEAIKVRKKDLEAKEAFYEQAEALVQQGLKTNADASRFLSSVYAAKDDLAIAYSLYEKAKVSLSLYMGENIEDDVELENELIKRNYKVENRLEKEVINNNYQLQIENQNIYKNILLHKSAKASHYGSIDAYASYNHLDTLNSYDSTLVGLTLTIPLYSGGRVSAQEQEAQISTQIAKEAQASKVLNLKEELSGLVIDIKRFDNTIAAKQAQINSANETKKVLEARYKEGLTTYIEVLDAVSVVLNAELGLLQTYYSKSLAINQIEYLKGNM